MENTKVDHGLKESATRRSSHWSSIEKHIIATRPGCIACLPEHQGKFGVNVHHCLPFSFLEAIKRLDLEDDPRNLEILCTNEEGKSSMNHHITLGHRRRYESYNPTIREDAITYKGLDEPSILSSKDFQEKISNRPKDISQWTLEEKIALRAKIDQELPPDPVLLAKYFPHGIPGPEAII
jgi:hypothetical protein